MLELINWELYWYVVCMFAMGLMGVFIGVSALIGNRKFTHIGHTDTMAGDDGGA